ncbi:hypothetical protein [Alkalimarinus sediminis]|nr:hypothetical protein [Alkalimarinus sediminis]
MLNRSNVNPLVVEQIDDAIDDLNIREHYQSMLLKYENVSSNNK